MTHWTEQQLTRHLDRTGVPGASNGADVSEPPFAAQPEVVLDLPVPVSVNKLRRINWRAHRRANEWKDRADRLLMIAKCRSDNPIKLNMIRRFEIEIILNEGKVILDLDNALKLLIDYLRYRSIIQDDGPKHMRKLTVGWGEAPTGCRVFVRPCA